MILNFPISPLLLSISHHPNLLNKGSSNFHFDIDIYVYSRRETFICSRSYLFLYDYGVQNYLSLQNLRCPLSITILFNLSVRAFQRFHIVSFLMINNNSSLSLSFECAGAYWRVSSYIPLYLFSASSSGSVSTYLTHYMTRYW